MTQAILKGHLAKVDLDGRRGPEVLFRCHVSEQVARMLSRLMLLTGDEYVTVEVNVPSADTSTEPREGSR